MIFDTEKLRENNINVLRTKLKNIDIGTKSLLSKLTNLSIATCGSILNELISTGEVLELELGTPRGGRPSRQFVYNFNYSHLLNIYLSIDNKKDYFCYEVINLANEVAIDKRIMINEMDLESIDLIINEIHNKYNNINKIAISVPGIVRNGYIFSCDIPNLVGINLKSFLEGKYSIKTIVENDVNILAFGALYKNKEQNHESTVYLFYPDKELPGMGLIVNNKLIRGFKNFAGEIKFLPGENSNKTAEEIQKNTSTYINYIYDAVKSINAIINPGGITISVKSISESLKTELLSKISKIECIGEIHFEKDIHNTLILGLRYLTTT